MKLAITIFVSIFVLFSSSLNAQKEYSIKGICEVEKDTYKTGELVYGYVYYITYPNVYGGTTASITRCYVPGIGEEEFYQSVGGTRPMNCGEDGCPELKGYTFDYFMPTRYGDIYFNSAELGSYLKK